MEKTGTEQNVRGLGDSRHVEQGAVLETWMGATLDTTETIVNGWFELLDEGRTLVSGRVRQTLDWAEGFPKAFFGMARATTDAIDRIAAQSIRAGDRSSRSVISAVRRAGDGARGFASQTASSIVGEDGRGRTTSVGPFASSAA